jgi:NAD(P)-dependent dehydrogenase (short-subunit alcohol dehydrogenase family)
MELEGKVALVTGASRGIGRAIAAGYAAAGAHVALAARDAGNLEAVAGEIRAAGGSCSIHPLDVTEHTAVVRTIDGIVAEHGSLDVLCNNAGVSTAPGNAVDVPPERVAGVFAVNVIGLYACCHAALPHMLAGGYGRIVNIGSGSAFMCKPGSSAYSSSKAAVNAITVALSGEVGEADVLVNAMSPGYIRSDMNPAGTDEPEESVPTALWLAALPKGGPTGRFFRFMGELPILPQTEMDFTSGKD